MRSEEINVGDLVFSTKTRDFGFCRRKSNFGIAIVWCSDAAAVGTDGDFSRTESEFLTYEEASTLDISKIQIPHASSD